MAEEEVVTEQPVKTEEKTAEQTTEVKEVTTEAQPDPVMEQALSQGWVDKDEWVSQGKPPGDWRSAEVFLERGEFMRKTSNLSKENKGLRQTVRELADLNKKVAEFERDKVLSELKSQKVQAMKDDDFERASDLDEQILELKSIPAPEIRVDDDRSSIQESVNAWVEKNQWYKNDSNLQQKANILMAGYKALHRNVTPDDLFSYVEREIRKSNPEKFRPKEATQKVAGGERTTKPQKSGKSLPRLSDLDFEHQKIARNFAEFAGIPVEETIKQWIELGEIS